MGLIVGACPVCQFVEILFCNSLGSKTAFLAGLSDFLPTIKLQPTCLGFSLALLLELSIFNNFKMVHTQNYGSRMLIFFTQNFFFRLIAYGCQNEQPWDVSKFLGVG